MNKLVRHPTKKYQTRKLSQIKRTILHCSDHAKADAYEIARWDITPTYTKNGKVYANPLSDTGAPGMTYHAFVDQEGDLFQAQDFTTVSWHAAGHNTDSVGVCIQYRATGNSQPPPEVQLKAAIDYIAHVNIHFGIPANQTFGHRELLGTGYNLADGKKVLRKECPGIKIDLDRFREDLDVRMRALLKEKGFDDLAAYSKQAQLKSPLPF